jgi:hypothetical protein
MTCHFGYCRNIRAGIKQVAGKGSAKVMRAKLFYPRFIRPILKHVMDCLIGHRALPLSLQNARTSVTFSMR